MYAAVSQLPFNCCCIHAIHLQLSSIPDLEGVQATAQYQPPSDVASAGASTASGGGAAPPAQPTSSGPPPPTSQAGPTPSSAPDEPIPPPPSQPGQLMTECIARNVILLSFMQILGRVKVNPLILAVFNIIIISYT